MRWHLKIKGQEEATRVELIAIGENSYRFRIDGKEEVEIKNPTSFPYSLLTDDFKLSIEHWSQDKWRGSIGSSSLILEPVDLEKSAGSVAKDVRTQMPGRILKIFVQVGQEVEAHAPLMIVEAMKMENEVRAPAKAKIGEIKVKEGQSIESGTVLLSFAE